MVNGSLDRHLFNIKESSQDQGLSWARRWSIINGLAAALLHLHSNGAVHGSVKSSNVLLDQDMAVRLGDFAYSRAPYTVSLSDITSLGLPPECCPEIVSFPVTEPTLAKDVFCFGSVILEVVCARKTSHGLVDWVRELYDSDNILGAVDKTLLPAAGDSTEADETASSILLLRVLLLGLACSHPDPSERPPMQDVVNILAGNAPVPIVPSNYGAAAHPLLCLETESPERQPSMDVPDRDEVASQGEILLVEEETVYRASEGEIAYLARLPTNSQQVRLCVCCSFFYYFLCLSRWRFPFRRWGRPMFADS